MWLRSIWHGCVPSGLRFLSFVFFKQRTAYEMRVSDWSSDVCSSDLARCAPPADVVVATSDVNRGPSPGAGDEQWVNGSRSWQVPTPRAAKTAATQPIDRKSVV